MAIPDFQTLMRPLLEAYSSGSERLISDVRRDLAAQFHLTDEELAERLPSGLARTFDNRVGWAATYLYRTGLLTRPRRAVYQITERGRDLLVAHRERIDLAILAQFPELAEFRKPGIPWSAAVLTPHTITEVTDARPQFVGPSAKSALASPVVERTLTRVSSGKGVG